MPGKRYQIFSAAAILEVKQFIEFKLKKDIFFKLISPLEMKEIQRHWEGYAGGGSGSGHYQIRKKISDPDQTCSTVPQFIKLKNTKAF